MMALFEVTTGVRISLLHMALYDEALEFYIRRIENLKQYKHIRNASALIQIVSEGLETLEFKAKKRMEWTIVTIYDMKIGGEYLEKSFKSLKKKVMKLQKTLDKVYYSEEMQCDFFRQALEDEPF